MRKQFFTNRPLRTAALIDPYWLGAAPPALQDSAIEALEHQLGRACRLERIYIYLENDDERSGASYRIPCTQRVCARDSIGDGFELVRAMDADLQQLAASSAFSAIVVITLDDRLALSIERAKAAGVQVFGLKTEAMDENDESFQRMARIFDRMLGPVRASLPEAELADEAYEEAPTEIETEALERAIARWFEESDEETRDGALEFMNSRRGLPRLVDSRLLYLSRELLGRELNEPEKLALRSRFREAAYGRAPVAEEH